MPPKLPVERDEDETALVDCSTTAGSFKMKLIRKWSPHGYDRAVYLFEHGFYDTSHFFRTVPGFLVQFGISYTDDKDLRTIANTEIPDDPQLKPPIKFDEGYISFAGSGKNSRTSQLFISYGAHESLGKEVWETPIGTVVHGMEHVKNFYGGYGDMPPWGKGPVQHKIHSEGRAYIEEHFPHLDRFLQCEVRKSSDTHDIRVADKEPLLPKGLGEKLLQNNIHKEKLDSMHDKRFDGLHTGRFEKKRLKGANLRESAEGKFLKLHKELNHLRESDKVRSLKKQAINARNKIQQAVQDPSSASFLYPLVFFIVLCIAFLFKRKKSKVLKKN